MILALLKHQIIQTVRSVLWQRTLLSNVIFLIIISVFLLNALGVGISLHAILNNVYPDRNHVDIINSILLYYFCIDLLLRFLFRKSPGLSATPYLTLPVPRKMLIHYVLFKTPFTFFNLFPLLILIPVTITIIIPDIGFQDASVWLLVCTLMLIGNGFFVQFFKANIEKRISVALGFLVFLICIFAADYSGIIDIRGISITAFAQIFTNPIYASLPVSYALFGYLLGYHFYRQELYENQDRSFFSNSARTSGFFTFFEQYGEVGHYISLELKLLLRNKRSRASLVFPMIMLVIAPVFFSTMSKKLNPYPTPSEEAVLQKTFTTGQPVVTFKVFPGTLPENAHIYITGDQPQLGQWKPDHYALRQQADSSWSRQFSFSEGTKIRYIYTLGSWATECTKEDGKTPDVRTFTVTRDTTIHWADPSFKVPHPNLFIDSMIFYMVLLFTGILMLAYGQFILGWESSYFDLLQARGINFFTYFKAKYILLIFFGVLLFLLNLPLLFFSLSIGPVLLAASIYNIGINSLLMLYLSGFGRKPMDLEASILSTQGKGGIHYLLIFPTVLIPVLFFVIFQSISNLPLGLPGIIAIGILGLIFYKPALHFFVDNFHTQRYKIASTFNQP